MYAKRIDSITIRRLKEMLVTLSELLEEVENEELTECAKKSIRSELKGLRRTMWGVLKDLDEHKELNAYKP